jgi:hypothetical protein
MRKRNWFGLVSILVLIGIPGTLARAQATWTDPATGLMWATHDSATNVDWSQARDYCANLQLGGYSGWRPPTIDEAKAIYTPAHTVDYTYYIKGGIQLSGWFHWASTPGRGSTEAVVFSFIAGYEMPEPLNVSKDGQFSMRVLCVRLP